MLWLTKFKTIAGAIRSEAEVTITTACRRAWTWETKTEPRHSWMFSRNTRASSSRRPSTVRRAARRKRFSASEGPLGMPLIQIAKTFRREWKLPFARARLDAVTS